MTVTQMPIRNRHLQENVKEAYSEGGNELQRAIYSLLNLENASELMKVAGAAYLQATLELACVLWTSEAIYDRKRNAERLLALARWMIQRWGTDAGEIISRIGTIGIVLDETAGDAWKFAMKGNKDIAPFTLRELFTDAIPNARAVMAGTYKNSLG